MNPEGLVTKKTSGKNELTPGDMAAASGMDESYVRKAMKHGFLNPPHYTSKHAIDGVQLQPSDQERLETHERVIKEKTKGKYPDKAVRESAIGMLVEEKKKSGQPVFYKWKEKSAEEVFDQFWNSPMGKNRMTGKLRNEINNIDRGGAWFDNPQGLYGMPGNYDQVLWETVRQEATKLQVRAVTGDQEAAKKYNALRAKWPEQLPVLDLGTEPGKEKK